MTGGLLHHSVNWPLVIHNIVDENVTLKYDTMNRENQSLVIDKLVEIQEFKKIIVHLRRINRKYPNSLKKH